MRQRMPALASSASAVGLALLGIVALITAPAAGAKTRIVWSRFGRPGIGQQLVSARPDGSHLRPLTRPNRNVSDIDASISPDGRRVAFERDQLTTGTSRIVMVGANDQNEHSVDLGCVDPCAADLTPTWLNSGSRIAFTPVIGPFDQVNNSARSAVLHTALTNGSDIRRLSQTGIDGKFEDYRARFSPDGSYVVFNRISNATLRIAVFRMDADGSHVRRLTPWKLQADTIDLSQATHGPTKDLVAFETYGDGPPKGKSSNVATVPSTCAPVGKCRKQIRYVTHHRGGQVWSFNPSWSPNGHRLAYVRFKPGDRHTPRWATSGPREPTAVTAGQCRSRLRSNTGRTGVRRRRAEGRSTCDLGVGRDMEQPWSHVDARFCFRVKAEVVRALLISINA